MSVDVGLNMGATYVIEIEFSVFSIVEGIQVVVQMFPVGTSFGKELKIVLFKYDKRVLFFDRRVDHTVIIKAEQIQGITDHQIAPLSRGGKS